MLTVQEFARRAGTPEATVLGWLEQGRLLGAVEDGDGWRIPERLAAVTVDPTGWIRASGQGPTTPTG